MKQTSFAVVTRSVRPPLSDLDFQLGRIRLAKHLGATGIASILVEPAYAKQLLLEAPSAFASNRVPLFVCELCADLGCGALSVQVQRTPEGILWQNFGRQGPEPSEISAAPFVARTGPFLFDPDEYRRVLLPYSRKPR